MAQYRYIQTRMWDDEWIGHLSHAAFRLFAYCITNESTRLSGYYEKRLSAIAVAIGEDEKKTAKLFEELAGKIEYVDGWVCIRNYAKHQTASNSPKAQAMIEKDMEAVPDRIISEAQQRFNTHTKPIPNQTSPIDRVSIPYETAKNKGKKLGTKSGDKVGIASSPYSETFERAWVVYPRKTAKGAAWKAWELLNPDPQLTELIIAKVALYKGTEQWKKQKGQYIPHFSTFLNQRRFDDTPEGASPLLDKYAGL